jgi:hypothetical protein
MAMAMATPMLIQSPAVMFQSDTPGVSTIRSRGRSHDARGEISAWYARLVVEYRVADKCFQGTGGGQLSRGSCAVQEDQMHRPRLAQAIQQGSA